MKTSRLKSSLVLLLLTSFLSCNERVETELLLNQCEVLLPEMVVEIDKHLYFDAEVTFCNCRPYKVSREFIGPLDKYSPAPWESCHQMRGYRPVQYTKLFNLMEFVRSNLPAESKNANDYVTEVMYK